MSTEFSETLPVAGWQPVHETLLELRHQCAGFEQFVKGLFDDLDRMRGEVQRKTEQYNGAKQKLAEREDRLDRQRAEVDQSVERLNEKVAELAETRASLETAKADLAKASANAAKSGQVDDQTQVRLSALERERDAVQRQLDITNSEISQLAHLATQLSETRKELAETRQELQQQREQVVVAQRSGGGENAQHTVHFEHERTALESELEVVRRRAAEMTEALAAQKRVMAQQRTEHSNQLKQQRGMLEKQADMLAAANHSSAESAKPVDQVAAGQPAGGPQDKSTTDPVVGSVMAQFAKLRKTVGRRRAKQPQLRDPS